MKAAQDESPPSAAALSLASRANASLVELLDGESCEGLLQVKLKQLDDLVEILVQQHQVAGGASSRSGPPKFAYAAPGRQLLPGQAASPDSPQRESCVCVSPGGDVSFDWLVALGCLNCGAPVDVKRDLLPAAEALSRAFATQSQATETAEQQQALLRCRFCSQEIAPLHFASENEALVDCLLRTAGAAADGASTGAPSGGVYVHGTRSSYTFPSAGKQRWQRRFLGAALDQQLLEQQLALMQHSSDAASTRTTCRELCEKCGHGEAFFSTFQARSADEGMTILYECTKCGHRKVFNN